MHHLKTKVNYFNMKNNLQEGTFLNPQSVPQISLLPRALSRYLLLHSASSPPLSSCKGKLKKEKDMRNATRKEIRNCNMTPIMPGIQHIY